MTDIKMAAMEFLRLAAFGKVDQAYDAHVGPGFVHHNPYFHGDRESLRAAMAEAARTTPNEVFEIQHVVCEGDFVAVHSRLRKKGAAGDVAVIHFFRFEEEKIVELWDVGQRPLTRRMSAGCSSSRRR
jgi:predicted SnoaL-like aldol condensation-catalyzing enzyme